MVNSVVEARNNIAGARDVHVELWVFAAGQRCLSQDRSSAYAGSRSLTPGAVHASACKMNLFDDRHMLER